MAWLVNVLQFNFKEYNTFILLAIINLYYFEFK